MKKILIIVGVLFTLNFTIIADEPNYSCPSGYTARPPQRGDTDAMIQTSTSNSCTNTNTGYNSGQNNYNANLSISAYGVKAEGGMSRIGESNTSGTSSSNCTTTTVKYVCDKENK